MEVPDDSQATQVWPNRTATEGHGFACIQLWAEPEFRKQSHEVLMRLAATADGYLPGTIMDVPRRWANAAGRKDAGVATRYCGPTQN